MTITETAPPTMMDLLTAWASQEPSRCRIEHGTAYVQRWGTWRQATLIGRLDEDRIAGAVQDALEARGWNWHAGRHHHKDFYYAKVNVREKRELFVFANTASLVSVALLGAYVHALECFAPARPIGSP